MNEELQYLKERIQFLEALLDINAEILSKALDTNHKLIEELKKRA